MAMDSDSASRGDSDSLASQGEAALRAGDSARAAELFRAACRLAPLRRDLREALAEALDAKIEAGDFEQDETARQRARPMFASEFDADAAVFRDAEDDQEPRVAIYETPSRLSSMTWIWFGVAGVLLCACLVGYILARVDVRETIANWQVAPTERRVNELAEQATSFLGQQRYDEAVAALDEALALEPAAPSVLMAQKAEVYKAQGDQLYDGERLEEAARYYEQASVCTTGSAKLRYDIGDAYYYAARALRVERRGPTNPAHREKIENLLGKARDSLEQALALDRDLLRAYNLLGMTYCQLGQSHLAIPLWMAVVKRAPDSVAADSARSKLRLKGYDVEKLARGR